MADETDAERADRLEQECEELTEQLHTIKATMRGVRLKLLGIMGTMRELTDG